MPYPQVPPYQELARQLELYSQLQHEYGAPGIEPVLREAERALEKALKRLRRLPVDKRLADKEPDSLARIRKLRPAGPRRIWQEFSQKKYQSKLAGAFLARCAGCTLGSIVESWPVERMAAWAREIGDAFPPTDYWSAAFEPHLLRYQLSRRDAYTRAKLDGVPVDDDIVFTLLGLLIAEDYGPRFTVEDVGRAWLKYLPYACTAERVALENLKAGVAAKRAAVKNNPYCEWIGADIRADPWGYLAPGWPERAAALAYRDAYLTHRRNGIYGEMFFAAAIAAAFTVREPLAALEIGLTEIPRHCALAKAVRWALKIAPKIGDYRQARAAVDRKFKGMHPVHTINNACLTVFGLAIGGTNVTRVIGETVAMGLDNDCTAATAGSIVGAIAGKQHIPRHWHCNFNNTVHSYLIGKKRFTITGLVRRFTRQARRVFE